ncbi:MAG: hypothetical protein IKZ51_02200 [Bacteroidales bacterium]|nr:hypothetical protein [Bacteroidales bacterium]
MKESRKHYRKPDLESSEVWLQSLLADSSDTTPIYPGGDGEPGSFGDIYDGGSF